MSLVMQYMGVLEEERRAAEDVLERHNRACDAELEQVGRSQVSSPTLSGE